MKKSEMLNKEVIATDAIGTILVGNKPVGCRLDGHTRLYLFREEEEAVELDSYEAGGATRAFVIEIDHPVTRAKAINAAEMKAYGLATALEVASFNASLARKARNEEDVEEVAEHDEFISEVKSELDNIGI